jgi:hypothetical protein
MAHHLQFRILRDNGTGRALEWEARKATMKTFPFLLALFFLCSCSEKPATTPAKTTRTNTTTTNVFSLLNTNSFLSTKALLAVTGWQYPVTILETPEEKEKSEIKKQARALYEAKDYAGLEALAAKYRRSKECYANGIWKLGQVYLGVTDLPDEATEAEWKTQLKSHRDWIKARPESITARVVLAEDLTSYAWKARGSGWADSVTEKGWELFGKRLIEAANVVAEANSLKEECPRLFSVMFRVALGLQMDRSNYDKLFEQAIKSYPEYTAYYQRRAYFLLPRWYGEANEWESDLEKSSDKIGGKEGDMLYARTVWCMHEGRYFTNIFKESHISWSRVDQGFEEIEKLFPDSLAAKTERVYLAALARDREKARLYFDKLEGKIDLSTWRTMETCIKFAHWAYAN